MRADSPHDPEPVRPSYMMPPATPIISKVTGQPWIPVPVMRGPKSRYWRKRQTMWWARVGRGQRP